MKKKIGIGLFILGVIMILIPLLLPDNSSEKTDGWKVIADSKTNSLISDEDIKCNCDSYNSTDYYKETFNATYSSKNKYWYLIPKEEKLIRRVDYLTYYSGPLSVNCGDASIENFTNYINEHINDHKMNFDKFYIVRKDINEKKFAILYKGINKENNSYYEELTIYYYNNENNYLLVRYQITNRSFSKEFIEKVINGFTCEENKAEYTRCSESNGKYVCGINITSIGKKIEFTVDKAKYYLPAEPELFDYQEIFSDRKDETLITVTFASSENLLEDVYNSRDLKKYEHTETIINNKKADKYLLNNIESYMAYYIVELDENLVLVININSPDDNSDEIIKDFSDFKLSNS